MSISLCHDETTVYYPQAPGRVYSITFLALAASADAHDLAEYWEQFTGKGDLADIVKGAGTLCPLDERPAVAPDAYQTGIPHPADVARDLAEALEEWMDWCDRDGDRQDAFDGERGEGRAA